MLKFRRLGLLYLGPRHKITDLVRLTEKRSRNEETKREVDKLFGDNYTDTKEITNITLKEDGWYYGFGANYSFPTYWFDEGTNWRGCFSTLILPIIFVILTAYVSNQDAISARLSPPPTETPTPTSLPSPTPTATPTPVPSLGSLSAVWDGDETLAVEQNASMILIVTRDFKWDHDDPVWSEIVFQNQIEGGVRYYYLYLDDGAGLNDAKAQRLLNRLKNALPNQAEEIAHYIPIAEDEFPWAYDVAYYDPYDPLNAHAVGISLIVDSMAQVDLNVELSPSASNGFLQQFQRIWNLNINVQEREWRLPPQS